MTVVGVKDHVREETDPKPQRGEVLLRVRAITVGNAASKLRTIAALTRIFSDSVVCRDQVAMNTASGRIRRALQRFVRHLADQRQPA